MVTMQWGCCLLYEMDAMALSFVIPDGYNGAVVYYTRLLQWGCGLLYQVVAMVLSSLSKMDKMVLSSVIPNGCCDTVGGHVFCNYS